ncbi:MAG: hypothetical protein V4593_08170 [Pseudomonadota bacterium]
MSNLHTSPAFQSALSRAAEIAGVSLEGLLSAQCTTDRTWGDRCGVVFYGATMAVCERAARFFLAYAQRQPRRSSYDAQSSLGYHGVMHFVRYSNGAQGWYTGALPPAPAPTTIQGCGDFVFERVEGYEGVAVNTTYYPCAD